MPKQPSVAALWTAAPLRPKKRNDFRRRANRQWAVKRLCAHCRKGTPDFSWNWVHTRIGSWRDVTFHKKCFKDANYKQCVRCLEVGLPRDMHRGTEKDDKYKTAWVHDACVRMPLFLGVSLPRLLRKRQAYGGILL